MKYNYRIIKIIPTKMSKKEVKDEGFDHNELLAGKDVYTYDVDVSIQREDKTDLGVYTINIFPFNRYGFVRSTSSRKMIRFYRNSPNSEEDTLIVDLLIDLRQALEDTFYKFKTFEGKKDKVYLQAQNEIPA